jgi:hypothetical protein
VTSLADVTLGSVTYYMGAAKISIFRHTAKDFAHKLP